jgi:hypothetical protein
VAEFSLLIRHHSCDILVPQQPVDSSARGHRSPADWQFFFLQDCHARVILETFEIVNKEPYPMEWTTPQHEEIDLNCEISSYANAEL